VQLSSQSTAKPAPRRWRNLRFRARLCVLVLGLVLVLLGMELLSRLHWKLRGGVPLAHPEQIWKGFFPEWERSGVDRLRPDRQSEGLDVLLLGGSVLSELYGDFGGELRRGLEARLGRPVRVFNLAYPGRTSLDSRLKYERLVDRRFDLVVVYHGINDTAMNCCKPGTFRDDYTHAPRFAQLRALGGHPEIGTVALPYTAYWVGTSLADLCRLTDRPRDTWNQHGGDVRTPPCLKANLQRIITLARERGDRMLLMTFATYIPEGYTEVAFKAKRLDYGRHLVRIAHWGEPENVARTVQLHNEVVRELAGRYDVPLVDQERLMPTGRAIYDDICHLTPEGNRRFVANLFENVDVERLLAR
jgi:hypothetical protein